MQPSKAQLFCFTYAGGTASFYDGLKSRLSKLDIITPEYPGHGERHREPFCDSFSDLADDMFRCFEESYEGGMYGLFGYSMGAITLVELLRRIYKSGSRTPEHVFLGAHAPSTTAALPGMDDEQMRVWVKQRTIRFGAVPEKLVDNKSFWRMYLPIYTADYSLIARYRFEELDLRSETPATVFYSPTDTPLEQMLPWKRYFTAGCDFCPFDGSHFFMQSHVDEIAAIIAQKMRLSLSE